MESFQKLVSSQEHLDFEIAEDVVIHPLKGTSPISRGKEDGRGNLDNWLQKQKISTISNEFPIYRAVLPNGKRVPLLKTLLTTACEKNCNYCSCRAGRNFDRYSMKPEELAKTFMDMVRKGMVDGLFLSSAIAGGGCRIQDLLLDSADILRNKMGYRGYIHLKLMPGSEKDQVEQAMRLSDRVSINLEAPNRLALKNLAPQKDLFDELLKPLRWVDEIRRTQPSNRGWKGRWSSSTTQFVVGGGAETDRELLMTSEYLYRHYHLARAYYSGFRPVPGTPLEDHQAVNSWRQHRLYQASFLLRDYHYDVNEINFSENGFLSLDTDPKLGWAKTHLTDAPLEVNRADYRELLRIPGIGPRSAKAIVGARRKNPFKGIEELRSLGIIIERVAPFLLVDGKQIPCQLSLW